MSTQVRHSFRWIRAAALAWFFCAPAFAQGTAAALPEDIQIEASVLETPAGQTLAERQNAFRARFAEGDPEALEIAKEVVALVAEIYGSPHAKLSQALTNLAIAQSTQARHQSAVDNFTSAIAIREQADGTLVSPGLVNPLRGLADTLLALDEAQLAIPTLERAIHVTHVNEGPNNLEQIPVLDTLSQAHLRLGDQVEATEIRDTMFRLQERRYERNSDEFASALIERARWFEQLRNYEMATAAYRRVIATLARIHGPNDVRLVEPLVSLAFVAPNRTQDPTPRGSPYVSNDNGFTEGRRAINKAEKIARANDDPETGLLATTLIKQGDWLMSTSKPREARSSYREAWDLLQGDARREEARATMLGETKLIRPVPLQLAHDRSPRENLDPVTFPERGFVEIMFDINVLGKPTNLRTVDSSPAGLLDTHVRKRLRRFIYRPKFVDGNPVPVRDVTYRHTFRYNEDRITPREREIIAETEAARAEARNAVIQVALPAEPGVPTNEAPMAEDMTAPLPGASADAAIEDSVLDVATDGNLDGTTDDTTDDTTRDTAGDTSADSMGAAMGTAIDDATDDVMADKPSGDSDRPDDDAVEDVEPRASSAPSESTG